MAYQLTSEMINSITDAELAWSSTRLLPSSDEIPSEFWDGNIYTQIASAIFCGTKVPDGDVEFKQGVEPEKMMRCVRAHLGSWEPKHEHKIAGVGYMIASACTIYAR